MAIKMRRGADADFRPEKMQPGELAVTVDGTRKVYAAFAAGDVKELSSKEDVDKTIASGLQSLETSTNNKLQSLEKKASSVVDKISSENHRVQEELSRYEYYTKTESDLKYTVAPRKEASSANGELKLTDADDGLSYLELQGNSEQYTNTANKNLIDLNFATDGYYVNNVNGALAVNLNYKASGYINVIPGESYFLTNASQASPGAMYNANKVYVQGVVNGLNVIPEGVKYVRISANKAIQTAASTQFEKGTQGTEIVIGAVDTPSPDYPSEVKSVGDIPKDSNGVEIRNLLDDVGLASSPESEWLRIPDNVFTRTGFRFTLSTEFKTTLSTVGYLITPVDNGLNYRVVLTQSLPATKTVEFVNANNAVTIRTIDFSGGEDVYFYIFINGTTEATFEQAMEIFKHFCFMVTKAAEVDEYRPYIGENNGLVKMEAAGKNMFVVSNVKPQGQATPTEIMGDTIKVSGAWYADCKIFNLKKNTNYTLSGTVLSANAVIRISLYDYTTSTMINDAVSKYGSITSADFKEYSATFNTENLDLSHDYRVMLYCGNGTTNQGTTVYKNIQLEEGTIKTEYQPYRQQITWIPLKEPLRKIADYADSIDKDGNVTINVVKRYLKDLAVTVRPSYGANTDGLFSISYTSNPTPYDKVGGLGSYPNRDFDGNTGVGFSNLFKSSNKLEHGQIRFPPLSTASPHYVLVTLNYSTVGVTKDATDAELKTAVDAWAKEENPYFIVYIFPESQFIDLYRYQIPAVYIETYDQETKVRCLNKVKPSDMTLDYKIAMSSLIKRLEALEAKTVQEV